MTEVLALDLDLELVAHLAISASVAYLRAEQASDLLIQDPLVKEIFLWQMDHCREFDAPASQAVLEDEFEIKVPEPQTAVGDLVERLRTRYMRNKGRDIAKNIAVAVNERPLEVSKIMLQGGRELADLTIQRGEVYGTGDYWRLMARYDEKAIRGKGPSLGYPELDTHFYGMAGVTFLIGPPKSCKSWLTVNAIKENIDQGFPYTYSLELPADEYTMRLQHMVGDIPYWKYLKKAYMESERKTLKKVNEYLDDIGTYRIEKPQPGDRNVQRMIERAMNAGATCVFIDQLQYVENRKGDSLGSTNNTGDYWEVCNDLRDYSDQIPIFVVHQFNRTVMKATEMPEAQQAKGSAAIEEVTTLALGLWANQEMRRTENKVELGTLASRNYEYESWNVGIELKDGCAFRMLGVVDDV